MTKTKNQPLQQDDTRPKFLRRMQIGISGAVIAIALIIIFMPKKTETDSPDMHITPHFTKQGECTISNRDDKPIISIDIEIADDDSKREIGMMGRPTMDEKQGMLFVFEQEYMAAFWMKNCPLSLDMIFINKNGVIVTICRNTTPFSEQSYSAKALSLLVLEVNAGFADKYGIKEGDRISWKKL
jgi:uncharacterized protein